MVNLQLMNLPGCSPDFNAGGVSWGWAREEATGKPWLGNAVAGKQGSGNGEGRRLPVQSG